ncbi:MAG: hypothetical protein KatS3mg027_1723 [Bacteroidia bacterium]|nr:MAG: hypothetical protein KatS3mg027_1723 [Bacteroidia bacterium]
MPYSIPIKIYEQREAKLGKESAHTIIEALEESILNSFEEGKAQLKVEVSEELKKELATKYDLKLVDTELRKGIDLVRMEIELVRKDMRIMEIRIIAVIVILFILSNPNTLEFLSRIFGIIK